MKLEAITAWLALIVVGLVIVAAGIAGTGASPRRTFQLRPASEAEIQQRQLDDLFDAMEQARRDGAQ
jgi:hypothetical protein